MKISKLLREEWWGTDAADPWDLSIDDGWIKFHSIQFTPGRKLDPKFTLDTFNQFVTKVYEKG